MLTPRRLGVSMRRRWVCGRMSPTRWVAADVWPLTWQSRQATPCMPAGCSVLRSAVALNCCCGNCVTSSRRPSRSLAFKIPPKISWKLSTVSTLPCETSPRSGRVVR